MNILSLFDGNSGAMVALERQGISVNNYYASEIDKYAMKVSNDNYPGIIQMGDINNWKKWRIDWDSIDLVIGGFPCQAFSFSGKQEGFDDPRGQLFFKFVEVLDQIRKYNPHVKFMAENVKMKQETLSVISYHIGIDPILINSALVSAQNRERYYWANWQIEQPLDRFIFLKDIIEDVEFSHIHQKPRGKNIGGMFDKKSPTLTSSRWEQNNIIILDNKNPSGRGMNGNIYSIGGKSATLTTNKGEGIKIGVDNDVLCSPGWVKWWDKNRARRESKKFALVCNDQDKAITLTARMYANWGGNFIAMPADVDDVLWRKLMVLECERLQGFYDGYTKAVSNSQAYKMLGNSFQVDTVGHNLSTMHIPKIEQGRLFG